MQEIRTVPSAVSRRISSGTASVKETPSTATATFAKASSENTKTQDRFTSIDDNIAVAEELVTITSSSDAETTTPSSVVPSGTGNLIMQLWALLIIFFLCLMVRPAAISIYVHILQLS